MIFSLIMLKTIIFRNLKAIDTDLFWTEAATVLETTNHTDFGEKNLIL